MVYVNFFIGNVDFGVNGIMKIINVGFKNVSNYFGIDVMVSMGMVLNMGSSMLLVLIGFMFVNGYCYMVLVIVVVNGLVMSLVLIDDLYNKLILLDKVCVCIFNVLYNVFNVDVYVIVLNVDFFVIVLIMSGVVYGGVVLVSM